jgi:DUF3102 family protein
LEDGLSEIVQTIIAKSARLDALKQRINEEHRRCEEAVGSALEHAINAGEGLVQMKDNLSHGTWGRWLRENFEGSECTAQAYMRLYRRRDEIRNGAADLSIRGALSSLSVPKPEPIETVEEATVPSISAAEVGPSVSYPPNALTRERIEGPLRWASAEVGEEHTEPREPGVIEQLEATAEGREALAQVNSELAEGQACDRIRYRIVNLAELIREVTPETVAKDVVAENVGDAARDAVLGRAGRSGRNNYYLECTQEVHAWLGELLRELEGAYERLRKLSGKE